MQVTQLATYPVKSLGGVQVERAAVTPQGLATDRRWAVVDPQGCRVSARECHAMLGLTAESELDGTVRLTSREGSAVTLPVPPPSAAAVPVGLSRVDRLVLGDTAASRWLSDQCDRELRLVHLADPTGRAIGASHGGRPGETMNLADAGPLLLITVASVQRLRDWVREESQEEWVDLAEAIDRFRANVVVDGDEPFAEDAWEQVVIGGTVYRRGELCDRCVMTTIDLVTLQTTDEPIRTLARHRRWAGVTWFGVRLIPELPTGATRGVAVGDPVEPQ